jgi:hypothetical protein
LLGSVEPFRDGRGKRLDLRPLLIVAEVRVSVDHWTVDRDEEIRDFRIINAWMSAAP